MKSKDLLEKFLEKKYPHTKLDLPENDKIFLAEYTIDRYQKNSANRIRELGIGTSYDRYFSENVYAHIVRDDIQ